MERLLILNPGSTSTKVAVFDDETPVFTESIIHERETLEKFKGIMDQLDYRLNCVLECLAAHKTDLESLTAIVSRGGLMGNIETGAYTVNDDMIWQLKERPRNPHPSSLGAVIAKTIADEIKIPAYIYDGITVDEMTPINRITGLPDMRRKGHGHTLNTRAAALRYAKEQGKKYDEITVITAHIGGGITVNLQHNGRIEDSITDEEGPFSPERTGGLPMFDTISLCFSGRYTESELMQVVKGKGGLVAWLGTADCRKIEEMIAGGDEKAKLVYDAMCLNIAKNIAKLAPGVCGKVDAVLLTGGVTHSKYVTDKITEYIGFLAPVIVYPGEDEMRSLALGGLRVLRGEEPAKIYQKVEDPRA